MPHQAYAKHHLWEPPGTASLRRHGSPGRTGCATVMRLQPELSQVGPNDDLAQTAWYRPSATTGLEGAT
ncbi:hypothetical protein PCANC_04823 [Puccinia coronata f. sp. avenae]|uniref:Uncharacterized protein n=1 Tax=Puccinia coronata f. sp. avenae TaxID=200324 RepID=A0A2N5W2L0_9BASI|nr:hypothetical protein PCANC_08917 [Puccinia coronata f. sp. avenae]PLW56484.1 hypothetical protein PCANC_04823 [Puccinia coronata f. sp. avenae]